MSRHQFVSCAYSDGPAFGVDRSVPPIATQIADGENGGVMMNEFPPKYLDVMREASGSGARNAGRDLLRHHNSPNSATRPITATPT